MKRGREEDMEKTIRTAGQTTLATRGRSKDARRYPNLGKPAQF